MPRRDDRGSLSLEMHAQPDDTTCGPTCLHAVYRFWGMPYTLERVIAETSRLEDGGTLAVFLAQHALRNGFSASIYTFNVNLFDPTWFPRGGGVADAVLLAEKLKQQAARKHSRKLRIATDAYLDFLELGGRVHMEDLTGELIRSHLRRQVPLLAGLSATYLYGAAREVEAPHNRMVDDDLGGEPTGHFVALAGWDRERREVLVVDPHSPDGAADAGEARRYGVWIRKLVCAILIGVLTYDGNLLVLEPAGGTPPSDDRTRPKEKPDADRRRGR
ncbi:MAG: hypothetical protein KDA22_11945 [Phycisphaerales bacterium]|nr:hypothetical protein [Phycisphaerales bacterium]